MRYSPLCMTATKPKRQQLTDRENILRKNRWIEKPDGPIQAELSCVPFDVEGLLTQVHAKCFSHTVRPDICFAATKYLAYITLSMRASRPLIVINSVFNHSDIPLEVVQTLMKHELIHLVVPARQIDAKRVSHPPEFWELERVVCPEKVRMWAYTSRNLLGGLAYLPKDELHESLTLLRPRYAKQRRNDLFFSMEDCLSFWESWDVKNREAFNAQTF